MLLRATCSLKDPEYPLPNPSCWKRLSTQKHKKLNSDAFPEQSQPVVGSFWKNGELFAASVRDLLIIGFPLGLKWNLPPSGRQHIYPTSGVTLNCTEKVVAEVKIFSRYSENTAVYVVHNSWKAGGGTVRYYQPRTPTESEKGYSG